MIDGHSLTLESFVAVARYNAAVELAGSKILDNWVQDAYALRCIPQIHGAVRDALNYV